MYSLPARGFCGEHRAAAHDRPEVEHVVPDPGLAVGALEHVEAVQAARVVVVQPGGEDAVGAQLAPVLVREDVVGIVRAAGRRSGSCRAAIRRRSGWRGRATRPSGRRAARASTALRSCCTNERTPLGAVTDTDPRVRRDPDLRRVDVGDVDLDDVVAERVIDRRADDLGARGHLGVATADRTRSARGASRDPGRDSRAARPRPCRRRSASPGCRAAALAIGPAHQIFARQPLPPDAVGEPARVGHLVERVDVERRPIDALARRQERVLDEVVDVAGRRRHRLRRVEGAVVVDPDRIVRIEARSGGGLEPRGKAPRGRRPRQSRTRQPGRN